MLFGEQYWPEALIRELPHSHYTFVIALPDQKTSSFLYGLNKALEYLGGAPQYPHVNWDYVLRMTVFHKFEVQLFAGSPELKILACVLMQIVVH